MNYHNCNFSTPNEWMKMPENGNNVLYPSHRRLQHTCASGPPFYKNNKRKIQPPSCEKSLPLNGFPGASANMIHFTPCGWSVHAINAREPFRHCRPNGVPHCNAPRFNRPHSPMEYRKYSDSMICKERESPRNCVKIKMDPEERHRLEWNSFVKEEPSEDPGYISSITTANETVSDDYKLQNEKFLSNLCDDSIGYKQCLGEDVTRPEETCPENIFSPDLIGNDPRDTFNDFSTTERVAEPLPFSPDAEDQKIVTLPSELEKAYETMDETALAVYYLNALYPPSSQAVNEVPELISTKPKSEINGNSNEVTEQIDCWNARDGRMQIKSEPNASVDTSKIEETQSTHSNAGTVQAVEYLSEECEKKHSATKPFNASNENEDNYFEENNQNTSRHNPRLTGQFKECEIKEEAVHESYCLINSPDAKLNNIISKQKMTFNNPIENINRNNQICIDDSDLCFSESTKFLDGINDDKMNSGKLSCVKKCMALSQIGLTEKFKTNETRCNQNSNSWLSTNCTQNVSNTNDFAIPMDVTSRFSLRKSQPGAEPNANSLENKKGKKRCASKQTPMLNSTSSTENLSSELNSKSDSNILSTHNCMTQSTPNNTGVPSNAMNTEVREPEFLYSNILELVSPVETSLSSVTNYLLQEPTDSVGNRVSFTVGDYHGSTDSHRTSDNPKCSKKKQKAVKRSKRSSMIQISVKSPQKIHYQQEVIKSSVTLLDNVFESDIDEYLDFDLRRSRKEKIKGKKEERKSSNKSYQKLSSLATQMLNLEKLKNEAGDFKSGKLNRDSRKCFNDAATQTSPMGTANNRPVLKRDAQTQWNITGEIFESTENLKVDQRVCQSQYQFSPTANSRNKNNVQNINNRGIESNYDSENLRKISPKKSTGRVSNASVKSDNNNLSNENTETSKNISTTTLKKSNVTGDQNLSINATILKRVTTSSEIKNLSEEYENSETTDEPSAGDRNKSRKDIGNLNENIKKEQHENGGNPKEKKFREKASNQMTNKEIGNGNDTEDEVKDKKCKMVLRSRVSRAAKLDNQKKKQINEERKPNLRVRRGESSMKKPLKSPDSQPIAHRLRPRNKGKT